MLFRKLPKIFEKNLGTFALNARAFNAYFGLPKYKELAAAQVGKKG